MKSARSCLKLVGTPRALVVPFAGCDSGGPEAFAPAGTSPDAPAATSTRDPVAPSNAGPTSQKRFKQNAVQTDGPQEQP